MPLYRLFRVVSLTPCFFAVPMKLGVVCLARSASARPRRASWVVVDMKTLIIGGYEKISR